MKSAALQYYSSLAPFRELFEQGNPILTYHKVGPRPMRVRLKGLYVSAALFRQQLAELKAAGFQSGSLRDCSGPVKPRQIVLTFDDGYVKVWQHAVGALARTHFNAIQFLPVNFLGKSNEWDVGLGEASEPIMDLSQVRDWLAAGHDIGSHTLTHPFLTRLAPGQAREEIFASKKKLEDLFGRSIEHFCYPYGDWSPVVRDWVIEAGYRTASTTDFGVNTPETSSFALRRMTARYRSRSLKALLKRIRRVRVIC
jgi:peptidoglycan/xylan/chitin deacetylase (PgdA/CDA1 family)